MSIGKNRDIYELLQTRAFQIIGQITARRIIYGFGSNENIKGGP